MELIIVWLLCGVIAGAVYGNKGKSSVVGFLAGIVFGPLGILFVLVTPTDQAAIENKAIQSGASKKCPHCAETIRVGASVCRYCGRDLANPVQVNKRCPSCGTMNIDKAILCWSCSTKLD